MPNQRQRQGGLAAKRKRRDRIAAVGAKRAQRRAEAQQRFIEPETGKQARRRSKSMARSEFEPTERQIKSEIAGSAKREGDLGQWWNDVAQGYVSDQAGAQTAFKTAEDATNARLAAEAASAKDVLQGLSASDASFAKLVGGPTNSRGLSQAAEAAAAAERQRASLQAPLTASRANYIASIGSRANAARLQGIQSRGEERSRRGKEQQDLQALGRERGAAATKAFQTLREQDQTYTTQQQAFGAKEGYNHALEQQSKLGYRSSQVTAAAQLASARAYSKARERGASAQEAVAAANKAAARIKSKGNENVAKIQGKNAGKDKGGYTVPEGESLLKEAGVAFKTPGEAVDYLTNRGVKRGVAKRSVHGVYQSAKRQQGR